MSGKLIELVHHCHLITVLLIELAVAPGYQQFSSSLQTTLLGVCEFVAVHLDKCRGDKSKMGLLLKEMCTFAVLWKDCPSIAPNVHSLVTAALEILSNSARGSEKKLKAHAELDLDLDFGEVEHASPKKDNEEELLLFCVEFIAIGSQSSLQLEFDLPSKLCLFQKSLAFPSLSLSLRLQWHLCNLEVSQSLKAIEMALGFLESLFKKSCDNMSLYLPIFYCKLIGLVSFAGRLLPRASSAPSSSSSLAVEICETVVNLFISEFKENRLNWAHRLCLGDCLAVFIETGPCYTSSNNPCESLMQWENVFLHLLRDPDFRVRHFMSRKISILFNLYENTEALYLDVERRLGVAEKSSTGKSSQESHNLLHQTEEELKTVLLTLAEIVCSCEVNEERILRIFVAVASLDEKSNRSVISILDEVAKRSRFSSRVEFLENSLSQIVSLWIGGTDVHSPRSIFQFPWNILEPSLNPPFGTEQIGESLSCYMVSFSLFPFFLFSISFF